MIPTLIASALIACAVGLFYFVKKNKHKPAEILKVYVVSFIIAFVSLFVLTVSASIIATEISPQAPATSQEIQDAMDRYRIVDSRLYDQKEHKMITYDYQVSFEDVDYPIVEIRIFTLKAINNIFTFKTYNERNIVADRIIIPKNMSTDQLTNVKVQDTFKSSSESPSGKDT